MRLRSDKAMRFTGLLGLALLVGHAAAHAQTAGPAPGRAEVAVSGARLAAIRAATERFRDLKVALREGYVPDPTGMCITSEMEGLPRQLGAMGVHYFRPDLLGITGPPNPRVGGTGTHTDFERPGVLIYEPQPDGSMQLVAIENLVFADAWARAGNRKAPEFEGHQYFYMHDNPNTPMDEAHGFEPHYELHFWLYRDNPTGMFSPFNPRAGCTHHRPAAGHAGKH